MTVFTGLTRIANGRLPSIRSFPPFRWYPRAKLPPIHDARWERDIQQSLLHHQVDEERLLTEGLASMLGMLR